MKKALIIVDYQYDFVDPKGSLYVKEAYLLKRDIEELMKTYKNNGDLVICTMDWHPLEHISFSKWPVHCVQKTTGAQLYISEEAKKDIDLIIKKGINKTQDSYSGFYVDQKVKSSLEEYLITNKVNKVEIIGVALDVCVQATYNDAKKLNFLNVSVNEQLCKPINIEYQFKY